MVGRPNIDVDLDVDVNVDKKLFGNKILMLILMFMLIRNC